MSKIKIAFIGGGSYQWGLGISRDLLATPDLDGSRLVLMDINPAAAADVHAAVDRVQARLGTRWTIQSTTSRAAALRGADFVIVSISTGGLDAMRHDLEIPWKYGIHQTVGDTVGPGGLCRALRNIPVFLRLAADVQRFCPRAWILNLTNPMTMLTRALCLAGSGSGVIGLCHEIYGGQLFPSMVLGFHRKDPRYESVAAGINHCIWLLQARWDGKDILPRLRRAAGDFDLARRHFRPQAFFLDETRQWLDHAGDEPPPREAVDRAFARMWEGYALKRFLLRTLGHLPMANDRHVCEFFGHFTQDAAAFERQWRGTFTTIAKRRKSLSGKRAQTLEVATGRTEPSLEVSLEPVAPIIDAMVHGKRYHLQAGNLPNIGQIANLPRQVVVETPCLVSGGGIEPIHVGNLPQALQALIGGHVTRQEMTIEAAMTGDRDLALAALMTDPMVQDAATAPAMLDEMMAATKPWLPQFRRARRSRGAASRKAPQSAAVTR